MWRKLRLFHKQVKWNKKWQNSGSLPRSRQSSQWSGDSVYRYNVAYQCVVQCTVYIDTFSVLVTLIDNPIGRRKNSAIAWQFQFYTSNKVCNCKELLTLTLNETSAMLFPVWKQQEKHLRGWQLDGERKPVSCVVLTGSSFENTTRNLLFSATGYSWLPEQQTCVSCLW